MKMVTPRIFPFKNELWHVNIEDVQHKNTKGFHSCPRCFEIGHNNRQCTETKKMPLCFLCGQFGHYGKNCLTGSCEKCFSLNHRTKNCRMVNNENFAVPCALCNCIGHVQDNCPDFWRRFHLTTDSNNMVKGSGTVNQRVFCYNCGNIGHFGFKCYSPKMNENSFPTMPLIVDYSPFYGMEIVGNMESEMSCFSNDSLIKLVRNYPFLFDKNHKNYEDNILKENQWSEIATQLNSTAEVVKNQWMILQDRYMKEKHALSLSNESGNGETKNSNWPILDEFLNINIEHKETTDNVDPNLKTNANISGEVTSDIAMPSNDVSSVLSAATQSIPETSVSIPNENIEKALVKPNHENPLKRQRTNSTCDVLDSFQELNKTLKTICDIGKDEIIIYCQSLAFRLKKLSDERRQHIRLKIEELMYEEEKKESQQ